MMKPSDYRIEKLRESIAVMRTACDRAEHELLQKNQTPETTIAFVLHELVWGLANANSGIQSALSECSRERQRNQLSGP